MTVLSAGYINNSFLSTLPVFSFNSEHWKLSIDHFTKIKRCQFADSFFASRRLKNHPERNNVLVNFFAETGKACNLLAIVP